MRQAPAGGGGGSPATIVTMFDHYFDVVLADSVERRHAVFRVRFDVYCREFRYEREEDCPNGMEQDEYDAQALHAMIVHRASGAAAGCVRIIRRDVSTVHGVLPLEFNCGHTLDHEKLRPESLPAGAVCEISRLAVHPSYRRRAGESESPLGDLSLSTISETERRAYPLVSIALFLAATAMVHTTRLPHVFAMMEPRLARLLKRSGLQFLQVGNLTDFHGPRAAHYIDVDDAIGGLKPEVLALYQLIHDKLWPALNQVTDFSRPD